MGNGERVTLANFWRDHSRSSRESGEIPAFFRDEYHAPVWSLPLCPLPNVEPPLNISLGSVAKRFRYAAIFVILLLQI